MPCHWYTFTDKDGVKHTAHVNMSAPRKRKCAHCGCPDAKALCDWPTGEGKTCDKPCCFQCRRHVDKDVDYCMDHWAAMTGAQGSLFQ